ncbi:PREDICTED: uncharacterized protein LOC108971608 [Bactrocera latifrons]|uniref:uncharacterized protein LOC108971608 n=1 Tax=Bactrocera latifrons TaxID=174628 RepID=UPI0008DDDDB5|nr:PREDICTED: uncharacterized protein LOC108971608 [Bactrocera latifrons]
MALLKCSQVLSVALLCTVIIAENAIHAVPSSKQVITSSHSHDLDSDVESEKDDLVSSSSLGYGYYSHPYLNGGYYGGYYPYYGGIYGLGYPYYGGYYGGHHSFHGHYW